MPKIMWPEGEPENAIYPDGVLAPLGRLAYSAAWALRGKRTIKAEVDEGHHTRRPARIAHKLESERTHTVSLEMRDWYKIPKGRLDNLDPDMAMAVDALAKLEA